MSAQPPIYKDQRSKIEEHRVAVLLAAGPSRRMGAFKPLLPFGDRTVIESCIDNLRAAGIGDIITVVGHRAGDIQERLKGPDISFALNPDPDSEMSVSIACGLEQVNPSALALMISLVDHPAVPPEVIGLIINEWKSGARLVQPEHKGRRGHPVLVDLAFHD